MSQDEGDIRLCTIYWADDTDTLGFEQYYDENYNCYAIELKYDGINEQSNAERAGVKNDDVLIEINGENIEGLEEYEVQQRLDDLSLQPLEILVAEPNTYSDYIKRMPINQGTKGIQRPPANRVIVKSSNPNVTPVTTDRSDPLVPGSTPPDTVPVMRKRPGPQPNAPKGSGNLTRTAVNVTFNKSIIRVHRLEPSNRKFDFEVQLGKNNEFFVGLVNEDSEAAKQGLQVGDRIVEIDSEPTYGMPELMMQRLLKTAANVGHVCIRVQPAPCTFGQEKRMPKGSVIDVDHAMDEQASIDSYMALFTRPSEPDDPKPHDCLLIRDSRSSVLGFDVTRKDNHDTPVVSSVQRDGVAHRSGLRDGDRIVYIDNKNVQQMESFEARKQSIQVALEANGRVNLLVFGEREFELLKSRGGFVEFNPPQTAPASSNSVQIKEHELKLGGHERDFGLELKHDHMTFVHDVDPSSTAYKAGIRKNDKIVSLNGKEVAYLPDKRIQRILDECIGQGEVKIVVARLIRNPPSRTHAGLSTTAKQFGQGAPKTHSSSYEK